MRSGAVRQRQRTSHLKAEALDPNPFLRHLFDEAVAAADPARTIPDNLPDKPRGRTIVVGAGKASAAMARAFEEAWDGDLQGLVVTRYGYSVPCSRIEIVEAAHPVPDETGWSAARRMLSLVDGLTEDDLVVALISGGGSSLLPQPPESLGLEVKQAVNDALLRSGATIHEMNCVRKYLSSIKGGRLAVAAHPARVVSLILSDIPGDDPALVASGPTIPDDRTREDALTIVDRYGMVLPQSALDWLRSPGNVAPDPAAAEFARDEIRMVGAAQLSLEAAARAAERQGIAAAILSDCIEGEARDVGIVHAAIARQIAERDQPFSRPVVLLSGGETTVTVRGKGRGGRNTEFLLGFALAVEGTSGVHALAADTDGIDGSEDNAGAFADGTTRSRLIARGVDPRAILDSNDAYTAFEAIGDLLVTGPTKTNVNDFRAILLK